MTSLNNKQNSIQDTKTACSSKGDHLRCARMDDVQVHVTISNDAVAHNNFK